MTNIATTVKANHTDVFNYASLATASYADFSKLNTSDSDQEKSMIAAIVERKEPSSFAELVAGNYKVIAHWKDRAESSNDVESSFSATLFQDMPPNNILWRSKVRLKKRFSCRKY